MFEGFETCLQLSENDENHCVSKNQQLLIIYNFLWRAPSLLSAKKLSTWICYKIQPFAFICFQNAPLYVLTSNIDKEIELQYRIHSALDIIDEKSSNSATNKNPDMRDLFLGLLYATENYKM